MSEFGSTLLGRLAGKKHYAKVCEKLAAVVRGEIIILDFTGVSLVSGSWLNSMLVPLMQWMTNDANDLFPVIENVNNDWIDDLQLVAEWNHLNFLVGKSDRTPIRKAILIGSLDPAQTSTLKAVIECGEVTGAELERRRKSDSVKATAWNNRLRDLFQKRLIRRRKKGREQIYSSIVKEVVPYG
jgi:hypothetical protein